MIIEPVPPFPGLRIPRQVRHPAVGTKPSRGAAPAGVLRGAAAVSRTTIVTPSTTSPSRWSPCRRWRSPMRTSSAPSASTRPNPGLWWGSRLAVARPYRKVGAIGTSLIRLAVGSAHARGCRRFLAHVQSQNAPLFHALHWQTLDEVMLHGHPHHFMQADLALSAADNARNRLPVASQAGRMMFEQIVEIPAIQSRYRRENRHRARRGPTGLHRERCDPRRRRLRRDPRRRRLSAAGDRRLHQ